MYSENNLKPTSNRNFYTSNEKEQHFYVVYQEVSNIINTFKFLV